MTTPTSIRDCMHSNPITINKDAPLVQAIERLVEFKLTGLTVVDDTGSACGKITELDCIRAILNAIYNDGNADNQRVEQAMTHEIYACSPEDSIVEVAERMLDSHQRRSAVIQNGKLVGQVSSSNILWALMAHSRGRRPAE
ncbi:CBS domain-containing protein [Flavobacteriaceae bacterium]|nr:CBS domain-containing protein [Flavobacteriaceae bacterium]